MNPFIKLSIQNLPIVLASRSPRRARLLKDLGVKFDIIHSSINEEDFPARGNPIAFVKHLSSTKAHNVSEKILKDAVIIAADTTVVLNGKILNKPISPAHAIQMLTSLSGKTHTVYTGISLINKKSGKKIDAYKATDVTFRELTSNEIEDYVNTGSPMDKAGSYGIQDDFGAVFVNKINGCFYNVVGLPLELLYSKMKELL